MPSPLDDNASIGRAARSRMATCLVWNRRLHYFVGLYLLFFCWLFAFTGLLLNHSRWQFAQFWPDRVQTTTEHRLAVPEAVSPPERARGVLRQLGLAGEIQWPANQSGAGLFAFQVSRPGLVADVKVDLASGYTTVQRNTVNVWGVTQMLHTFTGLRAEDVRNERDWLLTTVWALSMDAVAAGLLVMVFSSYIMWYCLKPKRRGGAIALLLGFVVCGAFISGLLSML